ncbi:CBM35 domain-containing protein [Streptomyces griseiscabiei]|uniref:CBM35 domain-containing protein n=1 Tax=Streptomyces griseiscabiei TaxID=2993540 RepID=A0ABU4LIZ1_9ACTN|nr:CBM35 domain-containing protein [Streptomyces griseiscabiei]MBZ3907965.1 carbohydrate-binding protein [Streptomyces griseiscabiei]MDX2915114.1 CBM35 domain-containing protein [Streptomyces griseiscabiei]
MTPGNNGASTPEDDDPFGYLYEDGQARGAQPPSGSYGYPNAVNRVRPVGERQYGQQTQQAPQAATAQYGQVPQQGYGQPQGAPGQPNAHYQAPESFGGGGAPTTRQQGYGNGHGGGGGRGRGPNTKGLLIGAIAVVAAVVIGIGVAMLGGDDSDSASGDDTGSSTAPSAQESTDPSPTAEKSKDPKSTELPKAEAKTLLLGGSAVTASDIAGAKSDGGFYVTNFNSVGSSITWKMEDVPAGGKYTLYVIYGVPGKKADATLSINGTAQTRPLNLDNFAKAPEGDYEKGWTNTYASIQLNKGSNEVKISCEDGNSCDVNFDQLYLEKGWK